jgi:hypothetical protein
MTSAAVFLPELVGDGACGAGSGTVAGAISGAWGDAGLAGCSWARVSLLGTCAVVGFRLDRKESERRRAVGLKAITSADVLNLLLSVPVGVPMPRRSLTEPELSVLATVPHGAVSFGQSAGRDTVARLAVPPLRAEVALIPARSLRRGLELAGRFAPFCARAMVLARRPREGEALGMEADFYGIGVIAAPLGGAPQVLVPPARFRRHRFTAAGWRFLEEVYRQVGAVGPRGRGPE